MSALWPVADLVKATNGATTSDWCAWRVEIDSRKVRPGDLFVAIKGENFDGHDFIDKAFAAGAIAAVVSREVPVKGNFLMVTDTLQALADIGGYNRNRSTAKVVGITGSVGKTSTKEMLKLALSIHGRTYATSGNYNNHIGTPLNLANLPLDTQYAVFEMGMNHAGEISYLTKMVRPHVAIVTGVEEVHREFFAGIDDIAKAKSEIFEGLGKDGIAIINSDQKYFSDAKNKITFGANAKADSRLLAYKPAISGCEVSASIMGETYNYTLAATGRHWAIISLSVLAAVHALGLDVAKSAQALAGFSEVDGRGRVIKLADYLLINDSYNASPASMRAAFVKTAEVWQAAGKKGRKVAVLGDMLELGETTARLHADLALNLKDAGFDKVYTAGELMKNLYYALPEKMRGHHAKKTMELLPFIEFKKDDVVLVKGSHGSKIYELAEALLEKEKIRDAV